jgi:hypothetical protein
VFNESIELEAVQGLEVGGAADESDTGESGIDGVPQPVGRVGPVAAPGLEASEVVPDAQLLVQA